MLKHLVRVSIGTGGPRSFARAAGAARFPRASFDAPFDLCQYRHVPADEKTHLACRFPGQSTAWSWRPSDGDRGLGRERNLTRGLYGLDWRIDLRDPRLPEEVQDRDRDAEVGDGPCPAAAQTVEKGGEECRKERP